MKINRKAVIFGISSYNLKNSEKIFFRKVKPWGIILFSRNIKSLDQLRSLVKDIKKIFKERPELVEEIEQKIRAHYEENDKGNSGSGDEIKVNKETGELL